MTISLSYKNLIIFCFLAFFYLLSIKRETLIYHSVDAILDVVVVLLVDAVVGEVHAVVPHVAHVLLILDCRKPASHTYNNR